jgi:protease-4
MIHRLSLAAVLLAWSSAASAENWIKTPSAEVSAHLFLSEADDATSVFLNPAGLATGHGMNLYLDLSGDDNEVVEYLASLQGGSWGFTYRHHDHADRGMGPSYQNGFGMPSREGNIDEYSLAVAYGTRTLQGGLARVWTNTDLSGQDATAWHIGLLSRPSRYLSLAAAVESANKPRFIDGRLRPTYRYGLSVRPLPSAPELLTLSIEGVHGDGASDLIDLSYGASVRLDSGLEFSLTLRDPSAGDLRVGGSIRTNFGRGALAGRARSVGGTADYRALASIQIFDEFWQRSMATKTQVATLDIGGAFEDEASGFVLLGPGTRGTQEVVRRLAHAERDRDIRAVAIRLGDLSDAFVGPVTAHHEEIHKALLRFRESGKPVVAYFDKLAGPGEIYVASAADWVVLPPLSSVRGVGVSMNLRRYQRMFEKMGVEWEADTAGVYKSTFHSWYTDSLSTAQRKAVQGLVDTAYDHLVTSIQTGRRISDADMAEIATGGILYPDDCLRTGLVDEVGWWEDALIAADSLSGGPGRKPSTIRLPARRYWSERWAPPPAVAVVPAYGGIHSGRSRRNWIWGGRSMGSKTVVAQLRAAAGHPEVKAIVFRVDSGGGSALASEEIRREILQIKDRRKIPFYVSMGAMAASGGYWIAMDGDSVFANATTLTGSIGVVWSYPVLENLYEKLGITSETVKRGEHADVPSTSRHLTPEEREMLDASLDFIYDRFVAGVAQGRGLPESRVREIAEGRVYLGREALELGLVDELGTLDDAVRAAALQTGIANDYRVLTFRAGKPGLVERMIRRIGVLGELTGLEENDGVGATVDYR